MEKAFYLHFVIYDAFLWRTQPPRGSCEKHMIDIDTNNVVPTICPHVEWLEIQVLNSFA